MINLLKLSYFVLALGLGLYYLRIYMKGSMCHIQDRIDGRIVLITGANTGLGLETAVELASRGGLIHMACRDVNKCRVAKEAVVRRSGVKGDKVVVHTLDLASTRSILSFSEKFRESVERLDILINNAGVMMCPYEETEDGFEMQIGVNHLGHFLLTNELLPLVKKGRSPRIIVVSSRAHERGSINTTDINLRGPDYGRFAAYCQSKLANVLHVKVLAKRLKADNVAVVSVHPGVVATELSRHIPAALNFVAELFHPLLWKTPLEGAQTQICCAVNPDLHTLTGAYFSDCSPTASTNAQVHNESLAELLWEHSEKTIQSKLKEIIL